MFGRREGGGAGAGSGGSDEEQGGGDELYCYYDPSLDGSLSDDGEGEEFGRRRETAKEAEKGESAELAVDDQKQQKQQQQQQQQQGQGRAGTASHALSNPADPLLLLLSAGDIVSPPSSPAAAALKLNTPSLESQSKGGRSRSRSPAVGSPPGNGLQDRFSSWKGHLEGTAGTGSSAATRLRPASAVTALFGAAALAARENGPHSQHSSSSSSSSVLPIVRRREYFHAHGRGQMSWSNGDTYSGEFANNLRHGWGTYIERSSGKVWAGQWRYDRMHGRGTLTCPVGSSGGSSQTKTYDGMFSNGLRHGSGSQNFPSGASYFGEWVRDQREGLGEYRFGNGDIYRGWFRANKRSGSGILKSANGNTFDGEWRDDCQVQGRFVNAASGSEYNGSFDAEGKMSGYGLFRWPDSSTYAGEWVQNMAHGYGVYTHVRSGGSSGGSSSGGIANEERGYVYRGCWQRNKKHSMSKTLSSSIVHDHEGNAVDPAVAVVTFDGGDEYRGQYTKGKMTGVGVYTYAGSGLRQEGRFENGVFQGPLSPPPSPSPSPAASPSKGGSGQERSSGVGSTKSAAAAKDGDGDGGAVSKSAAEAEKKKGGGFWSFLF